MDLDLRNTTMRRAAPSLCVVSHRLPMSYEPDLGWQRSPGGLVSALTPALDGRDTLWFGHCVAGKRPPSTNESLHIEPLPLTAVEYRNAVDGFANRTLWPALHGLLSNIEQLRDWSDCYEARGRRTAKLIAEAAPPNAVIWVHDYHHFAVSSSLRPIRPDVQLGLFCHTPIDDIGLSSLATARRLAQHLSAFDFIGTQTLGDAQRTRSFLEDHGHCPSDEFVDATPVGFDVATWKSRSQDPVVAAMGARYDAQHGVVAFSADRADYTKGLLPKLIAVEMLLHQGALRPDDFRLVQIAPPTRTTIPAYRFLRDEIRTIATRINADFARTDGLQCVELHEHQMSPRETAGHMRGSDLALVTPCRDGMNLVALEYAVLNGDRPVDLVLGTGSGAASYIGEWCRLVDGKDVLGVAAALLESTRLVRDRRHQLAGMSKKRALAASALTSSRWVDAFLDRLGEAHHSRHRTVEGPRGSLRPER